MGTSNASGIDASKKRAACSKSTQSVNDKEVLNLSEWIRVWIQERGLIDEGVARGLICN